MITYKWGKLSPDRPAVYLKVWINGVFAADLWTFLNSPATAPKTIDWLVEHGAEREEAEEFIRGRLAAKRLLE